MQGQPPFPLVKDLVLVGGGHAHALVLRKWGMDPQPGVRLTLVNPGPTAAYTGMLPGLVAGHYRREEILIDLVRLARFAGARLVMSAATGLDLAARQVRFADRPPVAYDLLSLDVGIGAGLPGLPGFAVHGHPVRPLGRFADIWESFVARRLPAPRVVILGAGLGGVELALAALHRLRGLGGDPAVTLLDRGEALPNLHPATRDRLLRALTQAGVRLLTAAEATAVDAGSVLTTTGEAIGSDLTLSAVAGQPQAWLAASGLATEAGFVTVSRTLQTTDPAVFAVGDCAHLGFDPRPKAGVFAVRAAPVLLANLRATLAGQPLQPFRPQRDYLKLVSVGGRQALADRSGFRIGGALVWRLKDRIDRRFMDRFQDYPAARRAPVPPGAPPELARMLDARPLCGGCGSKVGPGVLGAALAGLPPAQRADVVAGAGDDAATLRQGPGLQVLSTDALRSFTADPWTMARLAAVHALGDVWAMGAQPQAALAQVSLPLLSDPLQARSLAEIMAAASQVFRAAGADLVGGHTTQGETLTIGFTVTGTAGRVVTKADARPGDAILLTKALGTGTILAAEMALARLPGLVLGEAVAAALAAMARPLGRAAAILAPVAQAMTDVTGFGLAGHLLEILDASGVAAEIDLAALPLLPGAEALAAAGWASSLAPANRAALDWRMDAAPGPRTDLLVDPQTCGGLLACVPADRAEGLIAALVAGGDMACRIGTVVAGAPFLFAP